MPRLLPAAHRAGPRLLLAALAALPGLAFAPVSEAAVFLKVVAWPTTGGVTRIPICIVEGSSAEQRRGDGPHAPNPSLDAVIARVRAALAESWEAHSSVRFVGWQPCSALEDPSRTVGVYIHPAAENRSGIGRSMRGKTVLVAQRNPRGEVRRDRHGGMRPIYASGLGFKPWGGIGAGTAPRPRCIRPGVGGRMEYHFECVEQYAVHEFGHVLGFDHEWLHPKTPRACLETKGSKDRPFVSSAVRQPERYLIIDPDRYDADSIMTYGRACADVTGVRFGSERPSPTDRAAVRAAYPPAEGASQAPEDEAAAGSGGGL